MRKYLLIITMLCQATTFAQQPVFVSGEEGHKSYRIPAIISLPNGELLAFCEGRVNNSADFGDINIVMKRSRNKGKTWGPLQNIVDYNDLQAGNPAPVVDMKDPAWPKGRIFLFYNTGNKHEGEVRKGNGLREVWYKTSTDGGTTWSEGVNITAQTHRPANTPYNFKEDWRTYANTPGHAIQLRNGRLYVAANHTAGPPQERYLDGRAHGYYSDDHGKTFKLSEDVSTPGGNESMAAELSDGKLMMNIRNQHGGTKARIVAISKDGGQRWDTTYFDQQLPDPICQGSILSMGKNTLLFCNAASTTRRDSLTLRVSTDEGKTWKRSYLIDKSAPGTKGDHTAYSDLVQLSKNKAGILYEQDNYRRIIFVPIHIKK